jgi:predicted nucleic acid-binding protein
MKIFLDTSSLIKLYHEERGTAETDRIFEDFVITGVFLSEIAKIEFSSAIWKKVRTAELYIPEAVEIIDSFISDYPKYSFVKIDSELIIHSRELISKYGTKGLRTLDSIQLASIIKAKENISFVISADNLLQSFVNEEDIECK